MSKSAFTQICKLRKGDCFMYYNLPYEVISTQWRKLGPLSIRDWHCKMKFEEQIIVLGGSTEVYKISRSLFKNVERVNREWVIE